MTAKPPAKRLKAKRKPPVLEDATLPSVVDAAQAAMLRASEAALQDETAQGEAAWKLGDHLFKTAKDLGWSPGEEGDSHSDAAGEALLRRVEHALATALEHRRAEVAMLIANGVAPRQGWHWDETSRDFVWDAARALADEEVFRRTAERARSAPSEADRD